jgi:hypothetical protein
MPADNPKPDNIQSQPPQQTLAEIQANAPPPGADQPRLPHYDFKTQPPPKKPVIVGATLGGVIGLCGGLLIVTNPRNPLPLWLNASFCFGAILEGMFTGLILGALYREVNK